MKEYKLVNKSGETLKKVQTESLEIAIRFFADIKNLEPKKLLEIYKVELIK
jgi:hypothetical protein